MWKQTSFIIKVGVLTYSSPPKKSEQPAWSLLWKVREKFQELRLDPSLLSLATGSSANRCPKRGKPPSLSPSGKNRSTIGYLIEGGGAVPNSQFTIIWASYTSSAFHLICVPPLRPIRGFGNYIFPAFLWSGDLMSFQCQWVFTAGSQLASRHWERGNVLFAQQQASSVLFSPMST